MAVTDVHRFLPQLRSGVVQPFIQGVPKGTEEGRLMDSPVFLGGGGAGPVAHRPAAHEANSGMARRAPGLWSWQAELAGGGLAGRPPPIRRMKYKQAAQGAGRNPVVLSALINGVLLWLGQCDVRAPRVPIAPGGY